jgi:hypothetical protein
MMISDFSAICSSLGAAGTSVVRVRCLFHRICSVPRSRVLRAKNRTRDPARALLDTENQQYKYDDGTNHKASTEDNALSAPSLYPRGVTQALLEIFRRCPA